MSLLQDEWRAIPGTDGLYSVSRSGLIRSEPLPGRTGKQRGRTLKPRPNKKGYLVFRVCLTNGMQWTTTVHRAVASAFIGQCGEGMQINHKDGDKTNNRVENLEYVTCLENVRHSWATGLHKDDHRKGSQHNMAKLTESDARSIRAIYPTKSLAELGQMFGVTKQAIASIIKRKTWTHI